MYRKEEILLPMFFKVCMHTCRIRLTLARPKLDVAWSAGDNGYCGRGSIIWHTNSQSKSCYIGSRNPAQNRLITHATDLVQLRDQSLSPWWLDHHGEASYDHKEVSTVKSVGWPLCLPDCSGKAHRTSTRRNWAGRRDSYSVLVSSYSYYSRWKWWNLRASADSILSYSTMAGQQPGSATYDVPTPIA
jgi:hypothetical protein